MSIHFGAGLGAALLAIAAVVGPATAQADSPEWSQGCQYVGVQRADRTQVQCDDGVGYILFNFNGLQAYKYNPATPNMDSVRQPWVLMQPTNGPYQWLWLDARADQSAGWPRVITSRR